MKKDEWYFLTGLLLTVIVLAIFVFLPFLSVLALAAIFAVVLQPISNRLTIAFKGRSTPAAALSIFLSLIVVLVPLTLLLSKVVTEARDLYFSLSDSQFIYWDKVGALINGWLGRLSGTGVLEWRPQLNEAVAWGLNHLGGVFSGTLNLTFKVLLWVIALFYFLKDSRYFKSGLLKLSPLPDSYDQGIATRLAQTINTVVRGALLVAVIQAVLVGLGFAIFGVPNAALWGLVAAFAALVPGLGTALVLLPGIAYLLAVGFWPAAMGLLVWGVLLVGLIDNLLAPYLYGRGTKIHPLFMLFSVLGGLLFFGPAGFILGPVTLGLLAALIEIYQEHRSVTV